MRLDKFVANNTDYSRRDVRKLIKAQRIDLNGEPALSATQHVAPDTDEITIDDQHVAALHDVFLMLNKPQGYICANIDAHHPTVIDLVANPDNCVDDAVPRFDENTLQIAGRLDIDSTGFVLLTTDGQWNHKITAPSTAGKKVYRVRLENELTEDTRDAFRQGMLLQGEKKKTRPAEIAIISPHEARVTLSEGKYHQIKRMFVATGNQVLALHREAIAGVSLDPQLPEGKYRELSSDEFQALANTLQPHENILQHE